MNLSSRPWKPRALDCCSLVPSRDSWATARLCVLYGQVSAHNRYVGQKERYKEYLGGSGPEASRKHQTVLAPAVPLIELWKCGKTQILSIEGNQALACPFTLPATTDEIFSLRQTACDDVDQETSIWPALGGPTGLFSPLEIIALLGLARLLEATELGQCLKSLLV